MGLAFSAQAVTDFYKADNGDNFNQTSSWIGGVKPVRRGIVRGLPVLPPTAAWPPASPIGTGWE